MSPISHFPTKYTILYVGNMYLMHIFKDSKAYIGGVSFNGQFLRLQTTV